MNLIKKATIGIFLIVISFIIYENIVSDNFTNCQRYFLTNKENYQVGDTIFLTAVVIPEKGQKKIKVYRDFSNLYFNASYTFKNETPDSLPYLMDKRVETTKKRYQNKYYDKIIISKKKPYKHTFKGLFTYDSKINLYKIEFKDYGYSFQFSKHEYENFESFGFNGIWYPVRAIMGASLEESIPEKTIRLTL